MMKRALILALLGLSSFSAGAIPLAFTNVGVDGQTTIFRSTLGGVGLTQIGSATITDSNSATGGSNGVFSGFDLDFVFLDGDGNYTTTSDRVYGSVFAFTTGAIRLPTTAGINEPTALRPGPTIGSSAANTINATVATLNTRDGSFPSAFNTDNVFGWLTLGDGGSLGVSFSTPVFISGTEALFVGEVGTGLGELVGANVTASETSIPEPASLSLLGLGLAGLGFARRRKSVQA